MGERKFVFDLVENYHSMAPINIVTESELLTRLDSIINRLDNEAIDILLHGEAKEPERKTGKSRLIYDKATKTIKKESGEPTCLSISEDLPMKEPMRSAWRDCCDCVHEGEIGTCSCHECFDDPSRPQWKLKEPDKAHWSSKEMVDPTRCVCGKPYGHLSACNPEPPTDAREEWIQRMPMPDAFNNLCAWAKVMQQWFREMPR